MEPGAPDDVGHIETTVVFELGVSVLHPGDAGNTLHARRCEVLRLDPDHELTRWTPLWAGPFFREVYRWSELGGR